MSGPILFDLPVTHFFQSFQPAWLTLFMQGISVIGDTMAYFLLVPVVALFLYLRRRRFESLTLVLAMTGNVIQWGLKLLVARPRPSAELVKVLQDGNHTLSFPSGHTLAAIIFYGLLAYFAVTLPRFPHKKLVIWTCVIMTILMGISRIYLGAHWLSDVLAGYVLGGIWLVGVIALYNKYKEQYK